ncbi:hypothetical protein Trydic_g2535 [Trypoxylus dichotomus]
MGSLQQPKEKKVMGTAWSCFYLVGSAEYSRCEDYAMYLEASGRSCLSCAVKPKETITGEGCQLQLMQLSQPLREKRP